MTTTRLDKFRTWTNIPLVLIVIALLAYGALMVHSATSGFGSGAAMFARQMVGIAIGLGVLVAAWSIDYRKLEGWLGPLVVLNAALVISPRIPGLGSQVSGATRWLEVGGVSLFQPSEPAKLLTIVIMAIVISKFKGRIERGRDVAQVLAYLALPFGLILLQPDLGTGLVFIAITLGMLLVGGMKPRFFLILGLVAIVGLGAVIQLDIIREYQRDRLLVFLNPEHDTQGAGYNLNQSMIAIGSGGLTGKGLGQGTQSNLNFLPERHTDFIFSVLGEELGFVGAVVLLLLYLGFLVTALEIATSARDLLQSLIAVGLITMWTFHIVQNIGMTIGILPITGLPLPFLSFGSSSMITNLAGTGMLLSIWARRRAA